MKPIRSSLIFIALFSTYAQANIPSTRQEINFQPKDGSVEFLAIGRPSALRIHGQSQGPIGTLQWQDGKIQGSLQLDLSQLDTGISLRTHHMKEKYLETEKYRTATLTMTSIALPAEDAGRDFVAKEVPFTGELELHGTRKPTSGVAQIERHGNDVQIQAKFAIKITDYAIALPTFAGITVADEVNIQVASKAKFVAANGGQK